MSRFRKLWEASDTGREQLTENHHYTIGGNDSPTFSRVEMFDAAVPNPYLDFEGPLPTEENPMPELTERRPDTATLSFCGASLSPRRPEFDEWKEWNRARARLLLGGERVMRTGRGYTVFPEDEVINNAILGAANKIIAARIDQETGMPCEDFRDLCNHLVAEGLHTYADGRVSTFYLTQKAVEYVKKTGTMTSASQRQLKPKAYNEK